MARWDPVHVIPRVKVCVCEPSFGSPGPLYHFFAFSSSRLQEEVSSGAVRIK